MAAMGAKTRWRPAQKQRRFSIFSGTETIEKRGRRKKRRGMRREKERGKKEREKKNN